MTQVYQAVILDSNNTIILDGPFFSSKSKVREFLEEWSCSYFCTDYKLHKWVASDRGFTVTVDWWNGEGENIKKYGKVRKYGFITYNIL